MIYLLLLLLFVIASFSFGNIILKFLKFETNKSFEKFLIAEGIGIGSFSYLLLLLGYLGIIDNLVYILIVVILSLFIILFVKELRIKSIKLSLNKISPIYMVFVCFLGIIFICHILSCFIPITDTDSLYYHLSIPKQFIKVKKIYDVTKIFKYATFPQIGEMLYMFAIAVKDEILASFIHFWFAVLTTILIYIAGKQICDRKTAIISASMFISLPVVNELVGTAKIDLILSFYFLLSVYCLVRYDETLTKNWFWLSAIFCGFSFGTKYTGIFSLLSLPIFFIYLKLNNKNSYLSLKDIILFFVIFFSISSFWLVRNYVYTNNPFSPFLYKIFDGKNWNDFLEADLKNHLSSCKQPVIKYLKDFIGENGDIYFLSFLILTFLNYRFENKQMIYFLLLGVINFFLSSIFMPSIVRFLLPSLTILILVCGYIFVRVIEDNLHLKSFVKTIIVLYLFFSVGYKAWLSISKILNNIEVIIGRVSKKEFLSRRLNFYNVVEYANKNLDHKETILSLNDPGGFYFKHNFIVSYHSIIGSPVHTLDNPEDIVDYLKEKNINWIFVNFSDYYKKSIRKSVLLSPEYVNKYLSIEFSKNNAYLYRVK
ncbi:MAG: glycosyltransferase family 39 protein [Endomicrobia bacterium]|nr:glycosyltransferase family 39 protein [Endomicrobiia bacterium]